MANPSFFRIRTASRGYSFVELLAVVAILSALAGLTMGSLSPVKANALTAAGNRIADLLASARQNSLARHAFTAVVIKSTGDKRFSAYCLFDLVKNDDGNFAEWQMVAPWRWLPDGVKFDLEVLTGSPVNFISTSDNPPAPKPLSGTVKLNEKSVSMASDVTYQIFAPDGTLTRGAPVRLRLVSAAEDSGTGIVYTGPRTAAGQPANYYDIVIIRETGQTKVERL